MKRSTDTDKWKKKFFRNLPSKYKLFWIYICDECDHAGVWIVDFEMASILIGEEFTEEEAFQVMGEQIISIDKGERWFIKGYLHFHYGDFLTQNNGFHKSVIKLIHKHKIEKYIDIEILERSRVTRDPQGQTWGLEEEFLKVPTTPTISPTPPPNKINHVTSPYIFFDTVDELTEELLASQAWIETTSIATRVSVAKIIEEIPRFSAWVFSGDKQRDGLKEIKTYFRNWIPKQIENGRKQVAPARKFGERL